MIWSIDVRISAWTSGEIGAAPADVAAAAGTTLAAAPLAVAAAAAMTLVAAVEAAAVAVAPISTTKFHSRCAVLLSKSSAYLLSI